VNRTETGQAGRTRENLVETNKSTTAYYIISFGSFIEVPRIPKNTDELLKPGDSCCDGDESWMNHRIGGHCQVTKHNHHRNEDALACESADF
jgi:hypothetical protein